MVKADSLFAEIAYYLLKVQKDVMLGVKMYHPPLWDSTNLGDNHA
jgi:hypothetical protein